MMMSIGMTLKRMVSKLYLDQENSYWNPFNRRTKGDENEDDEDDDDNNGGVGELIPTDPFGN